MRRGGAVRWLARGLLLAAAGCARCGGCGEQGVAQLEHSEGRVERQEAAAGTEGSWQEAAVGTRFLVGDALRTGERSRAELALQGGGRLQVGERTVIRFQASPPGKQGPRLGVETGEVELLGGEQGAGIWTEVGLARIEPGGRLALRANGRRRVLRVEVGRAFIERRGEEAVRLLQGEAVHVDIGEGLIERLDATTPPAPASGEGVRPDAGADAALEAGSETGPDGTAPAPPPVATLRVTRGRAELQPPGGEPPRAVGRRDGEVPVAPGSEVRLRRRARATVAGPAGHLELRRGARLLLEGDVPRLAAGEARFRAETEVARLALPAGVLEASVGGAALVRMRGETAEIRALQGSVAVRGRAGRVRLGPGESARLGPDGRVELPERAVGRFHLVVPAGGRFTVRAARPPVAIGFRVGATCDGVATVELLRGRRVTARAHGEEVVGLLVPRGAFRYRVRCASGGGAEGRLRVVRDAGRAPLPRTPPSTLLDTDGRTYVVLYQNLLPEIVVRWKEAPQAGGYVLHVRSGGRERTFRVARPRHTLPSGTLPEGRHELWFEAAGRSSPRTTVRIAFDNAATVASVRAPADGSFAPGEQVEVRGVALPGWKVSAEGVELPLDPQHRFRGQVSVSPERLGLAIRMAHPSRGVQYYVRRARPR